MGDTNKTRVRERRGMIGQSAGAQTGKHTERKVKPADKNTRRETHQSARYAEIHRSSALPRVKYSSQR
jgi:hypothetical protein